MQALIQDFQEFFSFLCDFVDASADSFYVAVWKQIAVKLLSECVWCGEAEACGHGFLLNVGVVHMAFFDEL